MVTANPETEIIAQQFVSARLAGRALPAYPGALRVSAAAAYAIQDAAIKRWPEPVAGWKVGLVAPHARAVFGAERLVGPTFPGLLRHIAKLELDCPVFAGGFAAVEAEFVFRIGQDAPAGQMQWSAAQAGDQVDGLYVGVEIASSPLAAINDLGPCVTASDFGNHFGLLIGTRIDDWRQRSWDSLLCDTTVDGQLSGSGSAASVPGSPLAALAFALTLCAQRGLPLRAGQYVCTGATTGVHALHVGQRARVRFHGIDEINCRMVPAGAYSSAPANGVGT